ncbi:carbohydrate kinase family protein [Marmoricola sp. URHA0025 HA25]
MLTVGRANLDLYVSATGVPIADATDYVASVGGSPANIAIVVRKLGLSSAILSATGADFSGQFVRNQLQGHEVSTDWLLESSTGATSLALLSTLGVDKGERQFYRHNPADAHVEPSVVEELPWSSLRAVVLSADAIATGAMAETVAAVAHAAFDHDVQVWWDLDLRPNSWPDNHAYSKAVTAQIDRRAVVVGTEEEFAALLDLDDLSSIDLFEKAIGDRGLARVVLKRGADGATLYLDGFPAIEVPALSTDPVCTVGAGDATAGALVAARVAGQTWEDALRLAMTVAAWTVGQPYCSTGFPTTEDLGIEPLAPSIEADV